MPQIEPMLDSLIEQHREATIVRTQTTYLDLAVSSGTVRLHYWDKVEFSLKNGIRGVLGHVTEHPLLWNYNGPCDTVYLSGPAPDPPALIEALYQAVDIASDHWRTLNCYLLGFSRAGALAQLERNLTDGSGLLVQGAPVPLVKAVVAVCQQHGTPTYTLSLTMPRSEPAPVAAPFSVLFIGACYVIARDFRVQEL